MGFFRKLFRNRPEPTPEQTPAVSADRVAPQTPAQDLLPGDEHSQVQLEQPSVDNETQLQHEKTSAPAETPWWEAASDSTNERSDLSPDPTFTDDVMSGERGDESPAEETFVDLEGIDTPPAPSGPDMIVTQPVVTVRSQRSERDSTRELGDNTTPTPSYRPSAQGLAAAALRDIGRVRSINQDSVFSLLTTLPREGDDIPFGLFIVADGMGGHEGGEVASRLAVSSVARHVLSQIVVPALEDSQTEDLQSTMIEAIKEANRTIWDHARSIGSDMGTTCTAVLLLGSALYISHVGDSRAYVFEPDGLRLLTDDHSAVGRLIKLGQLAPSEAREHPLRSQLYRTVGQHPQIQVDFTYHHIGEGTHLLMGSDGLWGMIDEERMAGVLQSCIWPQDACRQLVALANLAGGDDNISVVVVSFNVAEGTTA